MSSDQKGKRIRRSNWLLYSVSTVLYSVGCKTVENILQFLKIALLRILLPLYRLAENISFSCIDIQNNTLALFPCCLS